jgi:hypothetical protein
MPLPVEEMIQNHYSFDPKQYPILILMLFMLVACAPTTPADTDLPSPVPPGPTTRPVLTTSYPTKTALPITPTRWPTAPFPTRTPTPAGLTWVQKENWAPANQAEKLLLAKDGSVWSYWCKSITRWQIKTQDTSVYALEGEPETCIRSLAQDQKGNIWAGTQDNILYRFDGKGWQVYTSQNGLPEAEIINQIVPVKEGLLINLIDIQMNIRDPHTGYFDGEHFREIPGEEYAFLEAAPNGDIWGVVLSPALRYPSSWVYRYQDGQRHRMAYLRTSLTAFTIAADGMVWAADGYGILKYEGGTLKRVNSPPKDVLAISLITALMVAPDETVWGVVNRYYGCNEEVVNNTVDGVYHYDGKSWRRYTTQDGLPSNSVCDLVMDAQGAVWVGSDGHGISRFNGQRWENYTITERP